MQSKINKFRKFYTNIKEEEFLLHILGITAHGIPFFRCCEFNDECIVIEVQNKTPGVGDDSEWLNKLRQIRGYDFEEFISQYQFTAIYYRIPLDALNIVKAIQRYSLNSYTDEELEFTLHMLKKKYLGTKNEFVIRALENVAELISAIQ